jgi:predicted phage terminase large subunit-like protein
VTAVLPAHERALWSTFLAQAAPKPSVRRWASPLDMAAALDPTIVRTPALECVNAALVDLAEGRIPGNKLAVFVSPQEGKSTLCSYWGPLWLLADVDADMRIINVSYSDEMARRWGADVKLALETHNGDEGTLDLGLRLRADSRAAGRWQVAGRRGGIYCAGIGGSITGKPADWICIDDPCKSLEEAQSSAYRERVMRTWQAVLVPRMAPGTRVVWVQTLWNESEAIQRILATDGADWRVVRIPAICDSPDDPLGRAIGEPMVSARGHRDWAAIRRTVGEYVFSALYQQRPTTAEGNIFKRLWWRYWRMDPTGTLLNLAGRHLALGDCWRFATVDLANSTKTSADYTVISAWARTVDGNLVLLDRHRSRIGEEQHFAHARPLVERWNLDTVFVEASQYATGLVREATRGGVPISPLTAEKNKLTRALPASAWCSTGRLWLPAEAPWLDNWVTEHAGFPTASHDDQVDTTAYAVRVAITQWAPTPMARRPSNNGDEIDFMNIDM